MTDRELQDALGMRSDSEVPRRWELVKSDNVVDSGKTRLTPSKRPAIVWIAREFKERGNDQ